MSDANVTLDVIRNNFCSDLNLTSILINPERCLMIAQLTDEIRAKDRSCRLGVVATMVDVASSDPVLAAWNPDWTATQDLSVYCAGKLLDGPVVVDAKPLRFGKKAIFVAADIYDGHGVEDMDELQARIDGTVGKTSDLTLTAKSLVTFTRIPRTATSGVENYDPNQWVGVTRNRKSERYNSSLLNERIGLQVHAPDSGIVEIANTPYVENSIGTINGGVQSVVMEAAATAMRPDSVATDIQIHFLSQLRVGPVQTRGSIVRDARDHSVVIIRLVDVGAGDKLLSTATVILQKKS